MASTEYLIYGITDLVEAVDNCDSLIREERV